MNDEENLEKTIIQLLKQLAKEPEHKKIVLELLEELEDTDKKIN